MVDVDVNNQVIIIYSKAHEKQKKERAKKSTRNMEKTTTCRKTSQERKKQIRLFLGVIEGGKW
jgi:hypothetical protein